MAEIFPFCAWHYDAAKVSPSDVLTQPYDKITPQMQERYYARSLYNLIAVEKGIATPGDSATNNVYTRARRALEEWVTGGVLVRESAPAIYAYTQDYAVPATGEQRTRRGFIALGRVTDYSDGVVHRHEHTLSGPRADRLELLRHTRVHTGQLFMLYSDPEQRIDALLERTAQQPPSVEVTDEYHVAHRLWPITDADKVQQIVTAMADCKLVIADGHHRYETAVAYRDECRATQGSVSPSDPHERVMMTFVNTESAGLTILPTHRVLANVPSFSADALRRTLAAWFEVQPIATDTAGNDAAKLNAVRRAVTAGGDKRAIGLCADNAFWLLTLRAGANLAQLIPGVSPAQLALDVVLLHRVILEKGLGITPEAVVKESYIRYEREMEAAVAAVQRGEAQACFLLNPVSVKQTVEMALAREVLPQKSTDFYPKLLSGLTIYRLDD